MPAPVKGLRLVLQLTRVLGRVLGRVRIQGSPRCTDVIIRGCKGMSTAEAHVETDRSQRYLHQLCSQFARELTVECSNGQGVVSFAWGRCSLRAEPDWLVLHVEAPDD